ncbi:MAG: hypothetical protein HXY22_06085, partial [Alphaproteobacteria bacterium]|nr:hypothetical protein [Alphaproteobacteria bacterium]
VESGAPGVKEFIGERGLQSGQIRRADLVAAIGAEGLLLLREQIAHGHSAYLPRLQDPQPGDLQSQALPLGGLNELVEHVVKHLKAQGHPDYLEDVTKEPDEEEGGSGGPGGDGEGDDLYRQAVEIVTRDRKATTSYIQRRLQIGYNRAARIIEQMEQEGLLSPPNHTGKREILDGN